MRLIILAAALALSACGERTESAAGGCAHTITHEVAWSNAGAPDAITARSDGPTCTQALVTLAIRNAAGDPLWVFASTYYDLAVGGLPPEDAPATPDEDMRAFLSGWAELRPMQSSDLPAWTEGMSRPGEDVEPLGYHTPFDREAYESLRQRALPMLCYAAAAAAVQCLVIDPASHAPTLIAAYGP